MRSVQWHNPGKSTGGVISWKLRQLQQVWITCSIAGVLQRLERHLLLVNFFDRVCCPCNRHAFVGYIDSNPTNVMRLFALQSTETGFPFLCVKHFLRFTLFEILQHIQLMVKHRWLDVDILSPPTGTSLIVWITGCQPLTCGQK